MGAITSINIGTGSCTVVLFLELKVCALIIVA